MKAGVTITGLTAAKERLANLNKQVKYAERRAVTAVARIAVTDVQTAMRSAFANPSNYTLNAFYSKPATASDPSAYFLSREGSGKGRPASQYLAPEIFGGPRQMKGFELLLGAQTGMQYLVPGTGVVMTRGQITQLLSRLNALRDQTSNITDRTTRRLRKKGLTVAASGHRSEFFIAREGGKPDGHPIGIYRLVGPGQVRKVMTFVPKAPTYTVRLPVEALVRASVLKNWDGEFKRALAAALATAR